ncbi:ATP-dependent helicase [Actinotalea sp. M2MS4P-6]|uniref:ATP-dependent helicase n=1 Tax=Actinotalea sp. M2MS4P-6 TaxID=2983762 RepID=UPI0021E3EBB4|nr:ATP-dependent DNA helicase [Actinotalea sp. M2MS4P-6]MCV2396532.1 ATP-dependent helicase [Actinotalea sp. M2MS4P-6]
MTRWSAVDIAEALGRPRPTPEQVAVIEAPLEPLLVVAGAGSGKTETMAARVVWLIANEQVAPDAVLGLTFTRKAAGELSERVRARLAALRRHDPAAPGSSVFLAPAVSTYHAYSASLVADHALRLGLEPASRLLGEAGRWQLAHEVVEHWAEDLDTELVAGTITGALLALADGLAEHLHDPDELRAECDRLAGLLADVPPGSRKTDAATLAKVLGTLRLRSAMAPMLEELTARKRQADLMDFADQVALAARVAREIPEVGAGERSRYEVVLLDEYQDTSVAQLDLLRHLFGSGTAGDLPGAGHPVTAVGDPHQSIYGWRGASAGGLFRFPEEFRRTRSTARRDAPAGAPGSAGPADQPAGVLTLSTSWRNDHAILAAANVVAGPLQAASPYAVQQLQAGSRAEAGRGRTACVAHEVPAAAAVAAFVAEHRTSLGDGAPATAAVLCRKRSQFAAVEQALRAAGLPVEVVGLGGLLTTPEVVDLVSALQAAHDPSRGDALMRLLTGPRARLGLADLAALHDWSRHLGGPRPTLVEGALPDVVDERSIVDALDHLPAPGWTSPGGRRLSDAGRARLVELAGVLRALRGQTFLPVADLVAEAEVLLGLDIEVLLRPVSPAGARAHLDAFRAEATRFDTEEGGTLGAFLAWLEVAEDEENGLDAPVAELDPEAVQVLTVHAAKGLEWDVVAVPGMTATNFPAGSRGSGWPTAVGVLPTTLRGDAASLPDLPLAGLADGRELSRRVADYTEALRVHDEGEERRLAYVAVTRARHALLLTGSWWRDGKRPHDHSPYLLEIAGGSTEDWVPACDRPERDADAEPPVWPSAAPLGARQAQVERAAAVVRSAAPRVPDDELGALAELLLAERERRRVEQAAVVVPEHLSASAVVHLAEDRDAFTLALRRPVPTAPSQVARRGTAFHAWVEQYFGRAALVDVDALPGADDTSVLVDPELEALRTAFLASEWADRRPVEVEVDVETPIGDVVVRSRIDAVFAEPDGGVVVVDWKTGAVPGPEALRSRELQLAVYRLAWSRRTGLPLDKVRAAFVYVAHGVTLRPEHMAGSDELEQLLRG